MYNPDALKFMKGVPRSVCKKDEDIVKWFNGSKGYGFIGTNPAKMSFPFSAIVGDGFRNLDEGQRVEFIVTQGERALRPRKL